MAEIDPLVAEILLKGDGEFLSKLKGVADEAVHSFHKMEEAAKAKASSFQLAKIGLLAIESAVAATAAATIGFIEKMTELSQGTILLADAFGTTGEQLQNIEQIFAASGVKVEQFERFAIRLANTIAREWPAIAESMRTYANESDSMTLRVSNAMIRVQDAQKALADRSAERFAQMTKDSQALEAAYLKLANSARHAALEQTAALQAVRGAQLSVAAAQQHLAELEGRPPSDAEKKSLALAQARQAVDTARRSEQEAQLAQQEKLASAALKRAQEDQAYDDLARTAAKNRRDDAAQRIKDENAVKEAIIARGEAEEKANKFARTNIESVKGALNGVLKGNNDAAKAIDLSEVSVQNLKRGIIAVAAESSKAKVPDAWETLRTIAKIFKSDTEGMINGQQRLKLITELSGVAMQSMNKTAAELLHTMEHNSDAFEKLTTRTEKLGRKIDDDREIIEKFRGQLSLFELTISQLSQAFAAAIAPAFTEFLEKLEGSIKNNDGLIHNLGTGLAFLGKAFVDISLAIGNAIDAFARLFTGDFVKGADIFKAAIVGVGVAIVVATGPIGVMIVALGLVVTAVGAIRDHWDGIVAAALKAWDAIKDNAVVKFLTEVLKIVREIARGLGVLDRLTAIKLPTAAGGATLSGGEGGDVKGHAQGGPIDGPGTTTSDSILARLSRGEFVVKAAAVQAYGVDLFHKLNGMSFPGFAQGGLVPAPVRFSNGGSPVSAGSTLNLTIGDRTFSGLKGPKDVIDDLASFAIGRQTSSAGRNPTWFK